MKTFLRYSFLVAGLAFFAASFALSSDAPSQAGQAMPTDALFALLCGLASVCSLIISLLTFI